MIKFVLYIGIALLFSGCASVPTSTPMAPAGVSGVYHRVERGETLWKISRLYSIDLNDLLEVNRIPDASTVEIGQMIFIPHRQTVQPATGVYSGEDFTWPAKGKVIATFRQSFGNVINKGVNIQTRLDAEIVASRSGKVIFCSPSLRGFGKTVIIDHGDGFFTVYARNAEVRVKVGDEVKRGDVIGRMSGRDAYLHFEIRKGHIPQNPFYYLSH